MLVVSLSQKLLNYIVKGGNNIMYTFTIQVLLQIIHYILPPFILGSCYPCQLYQKITCNCGETSYSVPCGREKTARPPKCKKICKIPSNCHHLGSNKQHNCHTGPCPKCKELCGKSLSCGHVCNAPCHENVKTRVEENGKAALPWEVRGPQFVIKSQPCPPCEVPVDVTCLGGHETVAYPCHMAKPASCGRKCGRELPCGNHTCLRECHR